MTEGLFLLTTLFVAYVIYTIINEKKAGNDGKPSVAASAPAKQVSKAESPKSAAAKAKASTTKEKVPAKAKTSATKAKAPATKALIAKATEAKAKAPVAKVKASAEAKKPAAKVVAAPVAKAVAAKPAEKVVATPKPAVPKKEPAASVPKLASIPKPVPAPAKKPVEAVASTPALSPSATQSDNIKGAGLKDPKTGEITTAYSNYRFTKRWIKEALVAEKLVDKVYKNDELNASIEAKIRTGIIKLEGIKKYQP